MTLRAKGCDISDDCYIEKVLEGLPDSYAIEISNASQMTEKADLNNLLLGSRNRTNANDVNLPKAMFSEKKGQNKSRNQGKPKPHCTHCKKKGHLVNDCFILHPELKNSQSNKQPSRKANMATTNQVTSQAEYQSDGGTVYGMMAQMNQEENDDLLIDCGANICVTNDRGLLTNYVKLRRPQVIAGCTGHDMKAEGYGELRLLQGKIIIPHFYYSSDCMKTLVSTRTLAQIGLRTVIEDDGMIISDKAGKLEMKPYEENGLHYIPRRWTMTATANATISMEEAHRRFGHASTERLRHLEENTTGLTLSTKHRDFCDTCAFAKSRVKPFPKERRTKPTRAFEIITSDLKGPLLEASDSGFRYIITFNCAYSTWCSVGFLQNKTSEQVLYMIKSFMANARSETGQWLTTLLTDNGTEYVNQKTSEFLIESGVKHLRSAPYSPQHNGQAERRNQTLMQMARCALIDSGMSTKMWPYAVSYAAYTLNRLPTKKIMWKTPFELWRGRTPDVDTMRPFGCLAYLHIDRFQESLRARSFRGRFIGYGEDKGQKLFIIQRDFDKKVMTGRSCVFHQDTKPRPPPPDMIDPFEEADTILGTGRAAQQLQRDYLESQEEILHCARVHAMAMKPPKSYKEAMQRPDAKKWREAAEQEIRAHKENNTWTLVNKPANAKVIKGRWVFTHKQDHQTNKTTHKARYVAKGFSQTEGVDYNETDERLEAITARLQDSLPERNTCHPHLHGATLRLREKRRRRRDPCLPSQQSPVWVKASWQSMATCTVRLTERRGIPPVTQRTMHLVSTHRRHHRHHRHLCRRRTDYRQQQQRDRAHLKRYGKQVSDERSWRDSAVSRNRSETPSRRSYRYISRSLRQGNCQQVPTRRMQTCYHTCRPHIFSRR
jgi:hypothetical protein